MSRQHDSLRRDLERRLESGEISFDQYRFMLAELARSIDPPKAPLPQAVTDSAVFVSQGDWQTFTDDPDSAESPFPDALAPQPAQAAAAVMPPPATAGRKTADAPPLVGITVGKYRMEQRVARGGMGEIWKAFDVIGERHVAIKLLPTELKHRDEEMQRVKQAFDRVQALQHQNICPIYQLEWDDQLGYFLVMKFLDAVNLNVYCRLYVEHYRAMPVAEVARVLRPVAAALDYAHAGGIVHRDIKPQNVMITHDGKDVQVVDFDLAAEVRGSVARATQSGVTVSGTFSYMSPEQWRASALDGRSDQYSLAMVAYEMLAGRLPFDSPDPLVLRHCVLEDEITPITGLAPAVQNALNRALHKVPGERFADCAAFIDALAGQAAMSAGSAQAAPPPLPQQRAPASSLSTDSSRVATFRAGRASSRRERLPGHRSSPGTAPLSEELRLLREVIAEQLDIEIDEVRDQHFAAIVKLSLASRGLTSLKPLEKCRAIKSLDVQRTEVADLTPLMGLAQLTDLNLRQTQVANLAPLKSLTRLQSLILDGTQIEDLTPLRRLTGLLRLSAQNTRVQNISPVTFLLQLKNLDLAGTWVRDIQPLAMLRGLEALSLSRTLVSSLEPLREMAQLKSLLLAGVSAANLTPLAGLVGLERLSLRGTRLVSLDLLGHMPALARLSIAATDVQDFEPLTRMASLRQIDLEATRIRDLSLLERLPQLDWLSLRGLEIDSLRPLASLNNLKHVDLTGATVSLADLALLRAALPAARIITSPDNETE
jgi:serine/threonine protein kinase